MYVCVRVCVCASCRQVSASICVSGENSCYLDFAFHEVCVKGMSNANKFSRQKKRLFLSYLSRRSNFFFLTFLFLSPSSPLRSKNSLPLLPDAAQLYQQYSEAAQNFEILRQARSDVTSVGGEATQSPAPSPPPARRPLPSLPQPVQHTHSLSHTGSITSIQSLPLPEPPRIEGRPSSPRLSISLSQSSTLWRELPAVRNSTELKELTEDERRLQEVSHTGIIKKSPQIH